MSTWGLPLLDFHYRYSPLSYLQEELLIGVESRYLYISANIKLEDTKKMLDFEFSFDYMSYYRKKHKLTSPLYENVAGDFGSIRYYHDGKSNLVCVHGRVKNERSSLEKLRKVVCDDKDPSIVQTIEFICEAWSGTQHFYCPIVAKRNQKRRRLMNEIMKRKCIECSICLSKTLKPFLLSCGHKFHKECIKKWNIRSSTCPFCRKEIVEKL